MLGYTPLDIDLFSFIGKMIRRKFSLKSIQYLALLLFVLIYSYVLEFNSSLGFADTSFEPMSTRRPAKPIQGAGAEPLAGWYQSEQVWINKPPEEPDPILALPLIMAA